MVISVFRNPMVALFRFVPRYFAQVLLRLFRWSGSFFGFGVRYLCVNRLAKSCGRKVLIFPGCSLYWLENCEIGENVTIHDFCYIDAIGGVKIGDNTRIAHNCSIISGRHKYEIPEKTIIDSGYTTAAISIGCDVWLSTGVVVTQGLCIGDGVVVGANSVVTKDVAPYSLVGGVPAKFIKSRFDTKAIERRNLEKTEEYTTDDLIASMFSSTRGFQKED